MRVFKDRLIKAVGADSRLSPDVVKALEEVQYNRGFVAGQENMLDVITGQFHRLENQAFEEMKRAAETFYQCLVGMVPPEDILEHRLGLDPTTGQPAALAIISHKLDAKMAEITDLANKCEMDVFDQFNYDCYFWVITDEKLDRFLIEQDFPFVRKGTADVNAR